MVNVEYVFEVYERVVYISVSKMTMRMVLVKGSRVLDEYQVEYSRFGTWRPGLASV